MSEEIGGAFTAEDLETEELVDRMSAAPRTNPSIYRHRDDTEGPEFAEDDNESELSSPPPSPPPPPPPCSSSPPPQSPPPSVTTSGPTLIEDQQGAAAPRESTPFASVPCASISASSDPSSSSPSPFLHVSPPLLLATASQAQHPQVSINFTCSGPAFWAAAQAAIVVATELPPPPVPFFSRAQSPSKPPLSPPPSPTQSVPAPAPVFVPVPTPVSAPVPAPVPAPAPAFGLAPTLSSEPQLQPITSIQNPQHSQAPTSNFQSNSPPAATLPQTQPLSGPALVCGDTDVRKARHQAKLKKRQNVLAREAAEQAAKQEKDRKHVEEVTNAKKRRAEEDMEMGYNHALPGPGKFHNSAGVSKRGRRENLRKVSLPLADMNLGMKMEMDWVPTTKKADEAFPRKPDNGLTEGLSRPVWTGNAGGRGVRGSMPNGMISARQRKNRRKWRAKEKSEDKNGAEKKDESEVSDAEVFAKVERMTESVAMDGEMAM